MGLSEDPKVMWQVLCADLDQERGMGIAARLVLQSPGSPAAPSTAPDRGHPTSYVICDQDRPQESMAEHADHVVRLHAAHMAQLSRPEGSIPARDVVATPRGVPPRPGRCRAGTAGLTPATGRTP